MRPAPLVLLSLLAAASLSAAPPKITPIVDLRLRAEAFETPVTRESEDRGYEFWNARLRAGADIKGQSVTLHGLLQAAGSFGLPETAAFGAGQALFAANAGNADDDPTQVGVAELYVALPNSTWTGITRSARTCGSRWAAASSRAAPRWRRSSPGTPTAPGPTRC